MQLLKIIPEKIKEWYESKKSIDESEILENFKKNYCNVSCKSELNENCIYGCPYSTFPRIKG